MRIVLASSSPRRRELLSKISGLEPVIRPSDVSEVVESPCLPAVLTMLLSERKAQAVFRSGELVLGSDTIVVRDGCVLNKPKNEADAVEMLLSLSERRHEVISGICLLSDTKTILSFDRSIVEFGYFSKERALRYVRAGNSYDKSGSYGVQDEEIKRITKSIEGSIDNIIGLPTELLEKIIRENF